MNLSRQHILTESPSASPYDTMDSQFGAAADLVFIVGPVSTVAGSNILALNTYIGRCRIEPGQNTLTLSSECNDVFRGINRNSGLQQNIEVGLPYELEISSDLGHTYSGVIESYLNSRTISLSNAPEGGLSFDVPGIRFSWGGSPLDGIKVGQTIIIQKAAFRDRPWMATVRALRGNYQLQLSGTADVTLQACYQTVIAGTDDSDAVNATVSAAVARGDRQIYCSGRHYTPRLAGEIANLNVIGKGLLFSNPPYCTSGSVRHVKYVANLLQPAPFVLRNEFWPGSLPAINAARSIKIVIAGDSLACEGPTNTSPLDCPAHAIQESIQRVRSGFTDEFVFRGIGGQGFTQLDGVANHFPHWYSDHNKSWLGTDSEPGYIHDEYPDILGINGDNNEGFAFDPAKFKNIYDKISEWDKKPGLFFWLSWPKSDGNWTDINSTALDSSEYFGQFVRGFCRLAGVPLLDFERLGVLVQYGFDPAARDLARRDDVPPSINGAYPIKLPWVAPLYTYDWGCKFRIDAAPAVAVESWGNELQFVIGGDKGGSHSIFRIGYNPATGNLYYQQDAIDTLSIIPKTDSKVHVGGDRSGSFVLFFYVVNEQVYAAYQSAEQPGPGGYNVIYHGPVARLGGTFQPKITSASGSGIHLAVDREASWKSTFMASAMDRFWVPRILDFEINGRQPQLLSGRDALGYMDGGAKGGDGTNHPTTFYHQNFIRPLIDAQFWGLEGSGIKRSNKSRAAKRDTAPVAALYQNLQEGLSAAEAALAKSGRQMALEILSQLRKQFADHPEPFFKAADLYEESGDSASADRALKEGQQRVSGNFGFFLRRAWLAHGRRNFDAAVERWDEMRQAFPDHPAGYHGAAVSLREAGRLDEAEAIATTGYDRHPDNPDIAEEHARAASMHRDFAMAVERWTVIVDRFPDRVGSHIGLASALRELGRYDDADATLRIAVERFPEDRSAAVEYAFLAQTRRDWPEAARRWREVRERAPDHLDAHLLGAGALRASGEVEEAEAVLLAAGARFPTNPAALIEYAKSARDRGDHAEAVPRWERLRGAFPDNPEGYMGGIAALSALGREPEAEQLLAAAIARFPANPDILRGHAEIALRREDWAVAAVRFGRLRERFPQEPGGYFGGAQVLQHQGRIAEAEALLEAGMTRLPGNPYLALQHALLATHVFVRNWDAAILRLAQLRARFAEFEPGYGSGIRVLREAGRIDEAEALALDAQARFPGRFEPALEHARVAVEREDWDQAVQRFTHLTEAFGNEAGAYVGLAQALSRGGRLDEAEAVLRGAMARFPGEVAPFVEYGLVAIRRNDWKAALERALDAQLRFPNDAGLKHRVFEARLRLAESDPSAIPEVSAREGDADDPRELMFYFESLGGSGHGCEFGLVQRKFGAEPIGLLRWADLGGDAEGLINALNTEFAGIGEPEHTELITLPNGGRNEYWTRDRRYWMVTRAFIFEDEIQRDKMYAQACRRLQYLRRLLIEDLQEGSKIFVYKNMFRNLTDDELDRLYAATRSYGDNTLLYVRFEDVEHPNGTVEAVKPGLLVGYIDHFAFSPKDEPLGEAILSWAALCREALRLRDTTVNDSSSRKFG